MNEEREKQLIDFVTSQIVNTQLEIEGALLAHLEMLVFYRQICKKQIHNTFYGFKQRLTHSFKNFEDINHNLLEIINKEVSDE